MTHAQPMSAPHAMASSSRFTPAVQDTRLRRVLETIESEPSRSIRELALEVSLSPAHLERLFKQETGMRLRDLQAEQRLRKAAHLLSATNMPIKQVAYAVGYKHHPSFVRAFRRRFAQTPRRWRQRVAAENAGSGA